VNILAELEREPHAFDFHAALRRLECRFRDRPRLGEAARPSDEPVRVGQDPFTEFAPAPLRRFRAPEAGRPGVLRVAFFGLFGPHGPLPLHLTEYARDRQRHAGDRTFAAFLDLFQHRMLLLFHRAWTRVHATACQDRPETNRFARYVGSLCGFGTAAVLGRDALPDAAKLYYAGWLANAPRSAEGLAAMIADHFGYATTIEEFVGEWVEIPSDARMRLRGDAASAALGRTTVLGKRVFLCQHKFRIVLGPLSPEAFPQLLPGGASMARLVALVRAYVGDELSWDVRLVPGPGVSDRLALRTGSRLGWTTRLTARQEEHALHHLIVSPLERRTRRVRALAGSSGA
jgi:type VI secretion system protein ImpH